MEANKLSDMINIGKELEKI